jgi:hypothetical protein
MAQRLGSSKSGWATTVWVDPGGTTGWGVMAVDPHILCGTRPIYRNIAHWACGETHANEDQMASEMLELFDVWDDAAIGIERFQLRQMAVELSPVSVTAKIEYGLWLMEKWEADEMGREPGRPRMVFKQDPNMAKRTLTDDRQREWGLWEPGKDHKRDAIKHCFTFLQRAQEKPRLRATAWPALFKNDGTLMKRLPPAQKRGRY